MVRFHSTLDCQRRITDGTVRTVVMQDLDGKTQSL